MDTHLLKENFTNNCLLVGDINSKHISWGSRVNDPGGVKLKNNLSALNISVETMTNNYINDSTGIPDVIDIIITVDSNTFTTSNSTPHNNIGSDHLPFSFHITNTHMVNPE
jgi:hypothetical protein